MIKDVPRQVGALSARQLGYEATQQINADSTSNFREREPCSISHSWWFH